MSIVDVVRESQARIARLNWDVRLVTGSAVDPDDVIIAQELIGCSLPAPYVELVTKLGPFKLADRWEDASRSFELLTPTKLLQETEAFRKTAKTVDPETAAIAELSLIVQFGVSPVDFYLLHAERGTVHFNVHDDAFSWDHGVSFDQHIVALLDQIEERVRIDMQS